jgi:hypothetical protein
MATNPITYRGNDAVIEIGDKTHSTLGLSDFSLTFDRGTVEQELVGEEGNYFVAGSMSIDGSLTACKLDKDAAGALLANTISGTNAWVSGSAGPKSLHFYFKSCAITGFDLSLGDADTITEGSIDFTVLSPYKVSSVSYLAGGGTYITDFG